MAATAATSGSISLRPELSLIVSLAHETQFPGDDYLPEELFESQAVATSSTIGKGSTFTVCRKKVHQPVEPPARPIDVNGIVVTHIDNSYKKGLPPYIVYKIAQVQFTSEGHAIAEHRSNLASAFLEIVVLTHRPIIRHPYLPLLYGFAWGHNRFSQYQRIPIPMLDWAEHGNLADFVQAKTMDLPQKRRACWEIGTALSFLHDCGIAHGDVKAENVLVFPDPSNGFLMKLSDFGLAVVSTSGSFNYLPRGTSLWAAPEIRWSNSDKVFPKEADVYSHGLLVWRIFCDGYDPLGRLFVSYSSGLPSNAQEISQLFSYLPRLIECDLRFLMENDLLVQKATSFMWSVHLFGLKLIATINQHGNPTVLRDLLLQLAMKAPQTLLRMQTIPWMIPVFENTLGRAPDTRNIRAAVAALEVGQTFEKCVCSYQLLVQNLIVARPKISPALISEVNNRRFEAAASNSVCEI